MGLESGGLSKWGILGISMITNGITVASIFTCITSLIILDTPAP